MKEKGFSGLTLKVIAVVTMFIDHAAAALLERTLFYGQIPLPPGNYTTWYYLYIVLRGIGRIAFPIYGFLLVEGLKYTHCRWKYALRLFVFALISEIPFDFALFPETEASARSVLGYLGVMFEHTNVFFTLCIGFLVIWGMDEIYQLLQEKCDKPICGWQILRAFLMLVIFLVGAGVATLLHTDYSAIGIAMIAVMYIMRYRPKTGLAIGVVILALGSSILELVALLDVVLLIFYNGTRGGKNSTWMKYFFYAFYPAHLAIIFGISLLLR